MIGLKCNELNLIVRCSYAEIKFILYKNVFHIEILNNGENEQVLNDLVFRTTCII